MWPPAVNPATGHYDPFGVERNAITPSPAPEIIGAVPVAGQLIDKVAGRLYRTALKPSTTLTNEEAQAVANTLLKEHIPISDTGMRRLSDRIGGLNQQVEQEIASNPTATVSPFKVAQRVDPAIDSFAYKDLQKDAGAAAGEKSRFMAEHSTPVQYSPYPPSHQPSLSFPAATSTYQLEEPIAAPRAQAMKKAIYQELSPNDFGTVAAGYKQARKMEARGLKEELEAIFPNIKGLNAKEGELLEARPQLQRAVNRTENRDVLGIGSPLMAGAVEGLTGRPSLALAAAAVKNAGSRTAILMDMLANQMRTTPAVKRLPLLSAVRALGSGGQ